MDWNNIQNSYAPLVKAQSVTVINRIKAGFSIPVEEVTLIQTVLLIGLACRLGIEITETHQRIAKCEKAINELKRAINK